MIYKGKQLTKAISVKRDHIHQGNFNNAIHSVELMPDGDVKDLRRKDLAYFIHNLERVTSRSLRFWKI